MKIAYIGGGSREWARKLMFDLALCSDFSGEVCLYDIDMESALLNERLGNWLQDQPGVVSRWNYRAVTSLENALKDADFVVLSIQPGTLETMQAEIAVAERHGLFFPVGDTIGAPGLIRGLRSAVIYQGFAHAIAEHCPDAWVINYTNPMTICTRTLTRVEPGLKVFGCCHEVFGTQHILADLVMRYRLAEKAPSRSDIRVNVMGINHFTFINRAYYKEHDLLALLWEYIQRPGVLRAFTREEVEARNNWFQDNLQVKFRLFLRLGILPAAGDRHLVEFLPGFTRSPEELYQWGIIRTPVSYRIERWRQAPQRTIDMIEGRSPLVLSQSGEEGISQIRAILGLGDLVTNVNLENQGQIPNLPIGAVVETNAHFSRNEVRPIQAGSLPASIHSIIHQHVLNQEMIVQAALTGDKDLAFQAMYSDPASGLPVDEAWQMFNELLEPSLPYLSGWKGK